MGNPPCYLLSPLRKGYGEHSTTERVWVFSDSLTNLRELKIQSSPFKIHLKMGYTRWVDWLTATSLYAILIAIIWQFSFKTF